VKAIILAGGLGTRLRERWPGLPKAMAPVAGRPFLEYVLDQLVKGGVRDVTLALGYRAETIQAHFGSGYRQAKISYVVESEPLGTGGAIAFAIRGEPDLPLLVLNGDTFLSIDYHALVDWYQRDPSQVAMVLRKVEDVARFGLVTVEADRVSSFAEKTGSGPGLINSGIYIIQPGWLASLKLPQKFSFETLLQERCSLLKPRAYVTDGYFIDIGTPAEFDRAQRELPTMTN
jgi:D-glycero-alpha-D-manno-heptose 1-phosphate guanylyltransferase